MMKRFCLFLICLMMGVLPIAAQVSVVFSRPGGFYPEAFSLAMETRNTEDPSLQIRYTLNGSVPTSGSLLYTHPLEMSRELYSASNIYKIPNTIPQYSVPAPSEVERLVVVRAAAFDTSGSCCSDVITCSYLIAPLLGREIRIPVLSLCVDSAALFDPDMGIFVPGSSFDPARPDGTGNYYRKGRDCEKAAYMELFDGSVVLAQPCGVRTHGDRARRYAQKGLSLYARKEYGEKRFGPVFGDEGPMPKHIVLKPFSGGWTPMGFQDLFCQNMAGLFGTFGSLNARPVVLFLNGEYWGIYFLEEEPDERYLEDHYGVDRRQVSIVRDWAGHNKDMDIDSAFSSMMDWLQTADLSDRRQYEKISKMVDVASFTDYVLFETFIGNRDWPANNMRCWSVDGSPWRFIFFDGDAIRTRHFDCVENALYDGDDMCWPTSAAATLLLRRLMQNAEYREFFVQRLDEFQRLFSFAHHKSVLQDFEQMVSALKPEIPYQSKRFGFPKSSGSWRRAVSQQRRYWRHRGDEVRRAWMDVIRKYDGKSRPVRWWLALVVAAVMGLGAVVAARRWRR